MEGVAVQNAEDLEELMKDPDKIDTNGTQHLKNGNNPYKHFVSLIWIPYSHSKYKLFPVEECVLFDNLTICSFLPSSISLRPPALLLSSLSCLSACLSFLPWTLFTCGACLP